jgi:hypothetical protein
MTSGCTDLLLNIQLKPTPCRAQRPRCCGLVLRSSDWSSLLGWLRSELAGLRHSNGPSPTLRSHYSRNNKTLYQRYPSSLLSLLNRLSWMRLNRKLPLEDFPPSVMRARIKNEGWFKYQRATSAGIAEGSAAQG